MFEDIIAELEGMGVEYTENYDMNELSINVADIDKTLLIDVINVVNNAGLPFTIDEANLVVSGIGEEEPMEEEALPEGDAQTMALDDMFGGM